MFCIKNLDLKSVHTLVIVDKGCGETNENE